MKITDIDMPKQSFIYAAIHLLSNRLQTIGDRLDPTISSKQWFLLAAISKFGEQAPNLGDIAKLLGTSRQNVKKIAIILERRGFLRIEKDKNDLRTVRLFLTEQCYSYFKSREQQEEEYEERVFFGFGVEELNILSSCMLKLIENIDTLLESGINEES